MKEELNKFYDPPTCIKCLSKDINLEYYKNSSDDEWLECICQMCGYLWKSEPYLKNIKKDKK